MIEIPFPSILGLVGLPEYVEMNNVFLTNMSLHTVSPPLHSSSSDNLSALFPAGKHMNQAILLGTTASPLNGGAYFPVTMAAEFISCCLILPHHVIWNKHKYTPVPLSACL